MLQYLPSRAFGAAGDNKKNTTIYNNFSFIICLSLALYFNYQAKFVPSFDYGAYEGAIHDPAAMMSVKVWYSPSRSYMQIKKIPGSVDCGQDLEADVALRFPHGHERTFYYKVKTRRSQECTFIIR